MKYFALDLGTTTGYAVTDNFGLINSGGHSFKPYRFEGGGMRYLRFQQWMQEMWELTGFEVVYFEEVAARQPSVAADHAYGGFFSQMSAWCEKNMIPYQGIPVGTVKKFMTGKGNAAKAQVIDAVRAKGFTPGDDNEADAIAVMLCAMDMTNTPF